GVDQDRRTGAQPLGIVDGHRRMRGLAQLDHVRPDEGAEFVGGEIHLLPLPQGEGTAAEMKRGPGQDQRLHENDLAIFKQADTHHSTSPERRGGVRPLSMCRGGGGVLAQGANVPARGMICYSTVTLLAKFRGLSTSQPRSTAIWYASSCSGTAATTGCKYSGT